MRPILPLIASLALSMVCGSGSPQQKLHFPALDGKDVDLQADVGRIVVIVPDGLSVLVDANIDGPGHLELFGNERGGIGIGDQVRHNAGIGTPELSIDANVSVGEIKVYQEGQL